jgi:hypothetical protein
LKIHDIVTSYQSELVEELFGWNDLDFMLHKHMIQYLSVEHMIDMHKISEKIIDYLIENTIDSKQVLNVGTGIGLLEATGRTKNYNIDSTEIKFLSIGCQKLIPNFDPYKIIRSKLHSKVTYWTNSIFDDYYVINDCRQKYDYGLLVRFTPLTHDCKSSDDVDLIFNNLSKYINNVLIIDDIRNIPSFLKKYKVNMIYKNNALYHVPLNNIITQN